jgi:hypothetical protein
MITITSPVMLHTTSVSMKVPSMATMPCSTGSLRARRGVGNRRTAEARLVGEDAPGHAEADRSPDRRAGKAAHGCRAGEGGLDNLATAPGTAAMLRASRSRP